MSKSCIVCGGSVVNGRCRLCGMPWRPPESLTYHLNEDRSEHYQHVSPKIRREMIRQEIPLGDSLPSEKALAGQNARKRLQSAPAAPAKSRITGSGIPNSPSAGSYAHREGQKKKQTRPGTILTWLFILIFFLISMLRACS